MNDRTQLKREEVVGDDVILTPINPKTNTKSVDDSATGVTMDVTVDALWAAINNKLSRIVNSVNGRTGVVVLNSDDVGLGNVDNVSYDDIKKWVITRLKVEFNNKRIKLYDNIYGLETDIATNDESIRDSAFYCDIYNETDKRACIGYIYWDDTTSQLGYEVRKINTVGWTDNSVIYNEILSDSDVSKDFSGGGLGVNIWKYEDALKLYNDASGSKVSSGLMIDKDNIAPKVYFYDSLYGSGEYDDPDAFIYRWQTGMDTTNLVEPTIKINGGEISKYGQIVIYLKNIDIKKNDIIITNFNTTGCYYEEYDETYDRTLLRTNSGIHPGLISRSPSIGQVTSAPTDASPNDEYVIEFYQLQTNASYGLKTYTTHNATSLVPNGTSIGVCLINKLPYHPAVPDVPLYGYEQNLSGINAFGDFNLTGAPASRNLGRTYRTILPSGITDDIFKGTSVEESVQDNSLYIAPNYSLCIIPRDTFNPKTSDPASEYTTSLFSWPPDIPAKSYGGANGSHDTYIGVNLEKLVKLRDPHPTASHVFYARNLSGLRITTDQISMDGSWFGFSDTTTRDIDIQEHSGGLSINVGDFLSIGKEDDDLSFDDGNISQDTFYDDGKLHVRIDESKGLKGFDNKIGINIWDDTNKVKGLFIQDASTVDSHNLGILLATRYASDNYSGLAFDRDDTELYGGAHDGGIYVILNDKGGLDHTTGGLSIKLTDNSGLQITDDGLSVNVDNSTIINTGGKISVSSSFLGQLKALRLTDASGNTVTFDPCPTRIDPIEYYDISLGPGLIIST